MPVVVAFLSGDLLQRQIGVGWASLRDLPPPADEPSLTVHEVDAAFAEVGATLRRRARSRRGERSCEALLGRATAEEQRFLTALLVGELRQGAQEGVMADAVARVAGVPAPVLRRAAAAARRPAGASARVALAEGEAGLGAIGLRVGQPLLPMLARHGARAWPARWRRRGRAAVEWKLDGVRVQVHRDGDEVGVYTRSLDDITARVPGDRGGRARAAGAGRSCSTARRSCCATTGGREAVPGDRQPHRPRRRRR